MWLFKILNTPVKLFIGLIVVCGLLWFAYYKLSDWWTNPDKINPKAAQYLKAARFWHGQSVQKDSVIAEKDSLLSIATTQIKTVQGYADKYATKLDSAKKAGAKALAGMTTAEKMKAYFQVLYENMTLARRSDGKEPDITSDEVITAGLQTANQEAYLSDANDSLVLAASHYKATSERRKVALRTSITKLKAIGADAKDKASKGGVWPVNRRRKRELREVAAKADSSANVLQRVAEQESELEEKLNKPN